MKQCTLMIVLGTFAAAGCSEPIERPQCAPVKGEVATFQSVQEGCFLYSGGLDRFRGELQATSAICNTCDSDASAWLHLTVSEDSRNPFLQAEAEGSALVRVPLVFSEGPRGAMVHQCSALIVTAEEKDHYVGPVSFPPSGELRDEQAITGQRRDDCAGWEDCTDDDGEPLPFEATSMVQIWPEADGPPEVGLSKACHEAQAGGDVKALIADEPHVRVELELDSSLSQELDSLPRSL